MMLRPLHRNFVGWGEGVWVMREQQKHKHSEHQVDKTKLPAFNWVGKVQMFKVTKNWIPFVQIVATYLFLTLSHFFDCLQSNKLENEK